MASSSMPPQQPPTPEPGLLSSGPGAGGRPAPPRQPGGMSLRGRIFLIWMIGLGSLYLLLVVALLLANISYLDFNRFWAAVSNKDVVYATKLSFITSFATVLLSLIVGVPAGYLLSRYRFPGHVVIDTLLDLPIVLPPLVVGVSLLIFFQTTVGRFINNNVLELVFTPTGIVLAQFTVACAFGIRTVKATFDQIDPRIENVARTLGASRSQAFFRVSLPMAKGGIMAAAVMTWARAIGEFGPVLIFCGTTRQRTEVLPTSIYLEFQVGNLQAALAISMLMVALAMATLLIFKKLGGKYYV